MLTCINIKVYENQKHYTHILASMYLIKYVSLKVTETVSFKVFN